MKNDNNNIYHSYNMKNIKNNNFKDNLRGNVNN